MSFFDVSISEISDSKKTGRYARQRADDALEAMKSYNDILKKKDLITRLKILKFNFGKSLARLSMKRTT